jgi:hypothetical protein
MAQLRKNHPEDAKTELSFYAARKVERKKARGDKRRK